MSVVTKVHARQVSLVYSHVALVLVTNIDVDLASVVAVIVMTGRPTI
jgi:hypothetical protein